MNAKTRVKLLFLSTLCTIGLFISLCWTAAADAQGAIAFFIYSPVLILLMIFNFYLGRRVSAEMRFGLVLKRLSQILAIFILFFYASGFLGMTWFSNKVIPLVSDGFEMVTGKTPMQWDKGL